MSEALSVEYLSECLLSLLMVNEIAALPGISLCTCLMLIRRSMERQQRIILNCGKVDRVLEILVETSRP